jgi:hypothetical protein
MAMLMCADRSRNVILFAFFSIGGGFMMVKPLAARERQRTHGDYSVSVDRSGPSLHRDC